MVHEQVAKRIVNSRLNGENMQREYHTKVSQELERYIVKQKEQSFCASEVYSYMTGQGIAVNLATIYRNLDRLTEKNVGSQMNILVSYTKHIGLQVKVTIVVTRTGYASG